MSQKSKKKSLHTPASGAPKQSTAARIPAAAAPGQIVLDDLEPQVDAVPMPAWPFIVLIAMAYWAMLHLDRYGGGFNQFVFGPFESYKQLADLQPKSGPEMLVARGLVVYDNVCKPCHQDSGLGSPGQFPPLAGSEWAQGPANRVIRIPLHGLTGNVTVKGQVWSGVAMPAFGTSPPLDNDENLAAVLTYVRQAWGNKAPPITPQQVKAVRAETAARTAQWTADELLKIE